MPAALIERVGRGVRPTAAGLLLTGYADVIGRQVAEAETALADLVARRTGRLTVRYFATAGAALVAPDVAVRPVRNPEPTRTIHAAVRETEPRQSPLEAFLRALRNAATSSPP